MGEEELKITLGFLKMSEKGLGMLCGRKTVTRLLDKVREKLKNKRRWAC